VLDELSLLSVGFQLIADKGAGTAPPDFLRDALKIEAWPEHRRALATGLNDEQWIAVARAYAAVRIVIPNMEEVGLDTDAARDYAVRTEQVIEMSIGLLSPWRSISTTPEP
jgi:hypothetical protein